MMTGRASRLCVQLLMEEESKVQDATPALLDASLSTLHHWQCERVDINLNSTPTTWSFNRYGLRAHSYIGSSFSRGNSQACMYMVSIAADGSYAPG